MQAKLAVVHLSGMVVLALAYAAPCEAQTSLRLAGSGDVDRLEQVLLQRGSLDVLNTPLGSVISTLSQQFQAPILLSQRRLAEAGIGTDTPVTKRVESASLESLLDLVLLDLDLGFTIRSGVILVTTPEDLESMLDTRIYPVRDLVLWRIPGEKGAADRYEADWDSLIDVITTTIAPDTWEDVGGPGSIKEFDKSAAIIVSQTREVHRQIEKLLATLRKARELQGIASIPPPRSASAAALPRSASRPISSPRPAAAPPSQAWQMPRVYAE
jgi:hypothetical protein